MKISVLDAGTLGNDLDLMPLSQFGEVVEYKSTSPEKVREHSVGSDVLIINKIKINSGTLGKNSGVKLICIAATGFDNVDLDFCREEKIGVCNVEGYSSNSVSQLTVAMALSLVNHIPQYNRFVEDGSYTRSGVQNRLEPVYHEICGKTWGIVGCGNIGSKVAAVAEALGCRVIVNQRRPHPKYITVDIDTLCRESDIISVHTPLTPDTDNLISKERIALMKPDAVFINVARGAVADERALADAIIHKRIGAIGVDVYSVEPFPENSPYSEIASYDNVCLTPHMAWGAYEARVRCLNEIIKNITACFAGDIRNRVDI